MYRREDISLYKVKKIESMLLKENMQMLPNHGTAHLDLIIKSVTFFKSAFNLYYSPMKIKQEPNIQEVRFFKNQYNKLCLKISFEELNSVFPKGFKVPEELFKDPLNRKTTIIFQYTDQGYQFVQLNTAPKFKPLMDAYFFQEKQLVVTILEQTNHLSAATLAEVRAYLYITMPTWNFPYQESNGLQDINYQKYVHTITTGLASGVKSLIRNICFLEQLLRRNYDLSIKEKGKINSRWDDESYNEELGKILPCNLALISYQHTAKLLALFACFDDDLGLNRPTAVIGAMSLINKFATAVANKRRNLICEELKEIEIQSILTEKKEYLVLEDMQAENDFFIELTMLRDNLFVKPNPICFNF